MTQPVDVKLFFNFRSPYCYLASKTLWPIVEDYHTNLIWRPVGGWDLRSQPDRAKIKVPVTRQDVSRHARRLGIPFNPPPLTTEPTAAGAASLLAEQKGKLREYIWEVMRKEWAEGQDIGEPGILLEVADAVGLDRAEFSAAMEDPGNLEKLKQNAEEAAQIGVIGVPSFVIDDQIFWGQDRIDFVLEELHERRVARI